MIILSWIAMIVCGIAAALPAEPSAAVTLGNSLCILAVAVNAFVIGERGQ